MNITVNLAKLRELRENAGLKQRDISELLGYKSTLGYHYIETGSSKIRADQLKLLADFYKVPIESLFSEECKEVPTGKAVNQ